MELNELKPAWQAFKAMQKSDVISEEQLNNVIEQELLSNRFKASPPVFKYVLAHTLLLLICQSC